jgi:hypothetical protein
MFGLGTFRDLQEAEASSTAISLLSWHMSCPKMPGVHGYPFQRPPLSRQEFVCGCVSFFQKEWL